MHTDSISIASSMLSRQNSQNSIGLLSNSNHSKQPKNTISKNPQSSQRRKSKATSEFNYKNIINDVHRKVKVGLRCRPIFHDEIDIANRNGFQPIVIHTNSYDYDENKLGEVAVTLNSGRVRNFKFDYVFGQESTQEAVYEIIALPIVNKVLEGYNGTIFAYGQSGTGKTYTMGILDSMQTNDTGIVPRTIDYIFKYGQMNNNTMTISLSFMQLYCESMQDLLSPVPPSNNSNNNGNNSNRDTTTTTTSAAANLIVREDPLRGFYVFGLQDVVVHSYEEAIHLITIGLENRAIAPTLLNATSSRSHTLLTLSIEQVITLSSNTDDMSSIGRDYDGSGRSASRGRPVSTSVGSGSGTRNHSSDSRHYATSSSRPTTPRSRILKSKLLLVDLAGSERVSRTVSSGQRLAEAKMINSSLSALGNVIAALSEQSQTQTKLNKNDDNNTITASTHIPYRDSKLTRLLQDSLGGTAVTALIATIGPSILNVGETLSTLNFASRCMNVKGMSIPNEAITTYSSSLLSHRSRSGNNNNYYETDNLTQMTSLASSPRDTIMTKDAFQYGELCVQLQQKLSTIEEDLAGKFQVERRVYEDTISRLSTQLSASTKRHVEEHSLPPSTAGGDNSDSNTKVGIKSKDSEVEGLVNRLLLLHTTNANHQPVIASTSGKSHITAYDAGNSHSNGNSEQDDTNTSSYHALSAFDLHSAQVEFIGNSDWLHSAVTAAAEAAIDPSVPLTHLSNELILLVEYSYKYLLSIYMTLEKVLGQSLYRVSTYHQQMSNLVLTEQHAEAVKQSESEELQAQDQRRSSRGRIGRINHKLDSSSSLPVALSTSQTIQTIDALYPHQYDSLSTAPASASTTNINNGNTNNINGNGNSDNNINVAATFVDNTTATASATASAVEFLASASAYATIADLAQAYTLLQHKIHTNIEILNNRMSSNDENLHRLKLTHASLLAESRQREEETVNWSHILKYLLSNTSKLKRDFDFLKQQQQPQQQQSSSQLQQLSMKQHTEKQTKNILQAQKNIRNTDEEVSPAISPSSNHNNNGHTNKDISSSNQSYISASKSNSNTVSGTCSGSGNTIGIAGVGVDAKSTKPSVASAYIDLSSSSSPSSPQPAAAAAARPYIYTHTQTPALIPSSLTAATTATTRATDTDTVTNTDGINNVSSSTSNRTAGRVVTNEVYPFQPFGASATRTLSASAVSATASGTTTASSVITPAVAAAAATATVTPVSSSSATASSSAAVASSSSSSSSMLSVSALASSTSSSSSSSSSSLVSKSKPVKPHRRPSLDASSRASFDSSSAKSLNTHTHTQAYIESQVQNQTQNHTKVNSSQTPSQLHSQPQSQSLSESESQSQSPYVPLTPSSKTYDEAISFGEAMIKTMDISPQEENEALAVINKVTFMTVSEYEALDEETQAQVMEFRHDLGLGLITSTSVDGPSGGLSGSSLSSSHSHHQLHQQQTTNNGNNGRSDKPDAPQQQQQQEQIVERNIYKSK